MWKSNALMVIYLLTVHGKSIPKETEDEANMCGPVVDILCVKDVLFRLVETAATIYRAADDLETKILQRDPTKPRLMKNIDEKKLLLHSKIPTSEYHKRFFTMNNINKNDLIRLIKEEHYATGYLYQSVKYLRHTKSLFGEEVEEFLQSIQMTLKNNMICKYRSILRVYSEDYEEVQQIDGIQIFKRDKHELSSLTYNTYSIITAQLLKEWTQSIIDVLKDVDNKLI